MESSRGSHVFENIENEFNELLKNPENFYEPQPEKIESFKQLSKKAYNSAVLNNINYKGRYPSKLLIFGFEEEQIWQQSDLLNKAAVASISQAIRGINPKNLCLNVSKSHHQIQSTIIDDNIVHGEIVNEDVAESEKGDLLSEGSSNEDYAFDDDSDSPSEIEKNVKKKSAPQKHFGYKSEVDDQFFKLSKLEEFLRIEDIKEEKRDEIPSNDEIDFFEDIPSDNDEDFEEESDEEENERTKKSSRDLMYEDFFDDPESEIGDESDSNSIDYDKTPMDGHLDDSFHGRDSTVEMKEDGNNFEEDADDSIDQESQTQKTAFELEQEKIKKKIQECEQSMLEPLPWHLTGQVDASNRPIDSLMDQEADFDTNAKQELLVDQALTNKIEEITRMAIMNKAFFDVERKYKPTEEIINYKKEVALDQTKSKKSLAEVYEEDYLKKQNKQDKEEEDPKHKEIKKLMDSLFPQLYALFSHIPKPAIPEIKIVSNLPAITVEEVAPTSVSDVTLLAPEEVKKKSGLIKGTTERTDTDRKRERRKKKEHQRLKEKKKLEKLESLKQNPSAKVSKLEKLEALKKLKQHKNTKIANIDEGNKIKSSKDFFSRLQDTVDTKNKKKTQAVYKKKKTK